jgi:hypothetical protein
MDIYSRKILSSVISNTLDASFCVDAYTEAVRLIGGPVKIDNSISVLAGHDDRSNTDEKDYIYGTWTTSYTLSNN